MQEILQHILAGLMHSRILFAHLRLMKDTNVTLIFEHPVLISLELIR